jgi:hypothetical protein
MKFQVYVERFFDCKIKSMQSDWGDEYRPLNKLLQSLGISRCISCPHTHQQNGAVEHKYHIVETALTSYPMQPYLLSIGTMPSSQHAT